MLWHAVNACWTLVYVLRLRDGAVQLTPGLVFASTWGTTALSVVLAWLALRHPALYARWRSPLLAFTRIARMVLQLVRREEGSQGGCEEGSPGRVQWLGCPCMPLTPPSLLSWLIGCCFGPGQPDAGS